MRLMEGAGDGAGEGAVEEAQGIEDLRMILFLILVFLNKSQNDLSNPIRKRS